jgi:phosphatidylglycerophosphate synthase
VGINIGMKSINFNETRQGVMKVVNKIKLFSIAVIGLILFFFIYGSEGISILFTILIAGIFILFIAKKLIPPI